MLVLHFLENSWKNLEFYKQNPGMKSCQKKKNFDIGKMESQKLLLRFKIVYCAPWLQN